MVEGRVIFGSLLISMGTVILGIILGLRYLAGTLGGSDELNSIVLVVLYVVLLIGAILYSFTNVLADRFGSMDENEEEEGGSSSSGTL